MSKAYYLTINRMFVIKSLFSAGVYNKLPKTPPYHYLGGAATARIPRMGPKKQGLS
jgi:hypothetical protein